MTNNHNDIAKNIAAVNSRIQEYANKHHRLAEEVQLLTVSKTFPAEDIQTAYNTGQHSFGENYVDEAVAKIIQLSALDIEWHYIGPIQSNKTRRIAEHFDWVHSLASEKHARRLHDQRPENMLPLNICIQVNISHEDSKSGIDTEEVLTLAETISNLPRLRLRGIMGIPAAETDFEKQRQAFAALASIYKDLKDAAYPVDTLSIGMTGDMEAAIAEGSTMVRIGTAIFGQRQPRQTA